jgi:23S rRNA pseudouridine2605 synthase
MRVVMGEGKKRQIRETGRLLGLPVVKIIRLRIGTLKLGNLKPNQWRYLTSDEIAELKGEEIAPKPPVKYTRRPALKAISKDKPKRPPAAGKPLKKLAY